MVKESGLSLTSTGVDPVQAQAALLGMWAWEAAEIHLKIKTFLDSYNKKDNKKTSLTLDLKVWPVEFFSESGTTINHI